MELIEISPFFALDAEDLIRSGSLAEARELCLMGVSAYPDYPAGYCVLADKSYEILESASVRFPGNRAVGAKIEMFSKKVRELSPDIQIDDDVIVSSGGVIDFVPEETEITGSIDSFESLTLEVNESVEVDESIIDEDSNPLYNRKNFIRDLPFNAEHFRKNDLLRARNLALIPGLESSPLIPSNSQELSRNYLEDIMSFPQARSEALEKVKQLKLRNNQQSNIDISLFDDRFDDDYNDSTPVSPVMTETLAKIYESQQLWATAISAYEILAEKNPENAEFYHPKIAALKEKV
jgi:hypothetical protein